MKTYVVTPHWNCLCETVLVIGHNMIGRNIYFKGVLWELIHKLPLLHLLIWSTGNSTFSISDIYLYYKCKKKKKKACKQLVCLTGDLGCLTADQYEVSGVPVFRLQDGVNHSRMMIDI